MTVERCGCSNTFLTYVSLPRPSPEDHAALGRPPGLTRKAAKRSYPPGQHGQARRKRSEYAIRLEEKQKLASTTACLNANSCAT